MDLGLILSLLGVGILCCTIGVGRCVYWYYRERPKS